MISESDLKHRIISILMHYGEGQQMRVAAEECCELAHVLLKSCRGNGAPTREAVLDEYADVWVMMVQMQHIFAFTPEEVREVAASKVTRTIDAIKKAEGDV